MCANCEIYGADHDSPTEPGRPLSNLRVHRTLAPMINEPVFFDTPINAVTYIGVRKAALTAYRRETTQMIKFAMFIAAFGAGLMALVELSYHGWL